MVFVNIITALAYALYWFMPAGVANMAPVIAAKLPILRRWNSPVDGGKKWGKYRILGDHKTWRGLVTGVIAANITIFLQRSVFVYDSPFNQLNPYLVGTLLGIGALGGDMIKSFFKRHMSIRSGKPWFPWDQIDYIIGGFIAVSTIVQLPLQLLVLTGLIYFLLHLLVSLVGYKLKFKLSPI